MERFLALSSDYIGAEAIRGLVFLKALQPTTMRKQKRRPEENWREREVKVGRRELL